MAFFTPAHSRPVGLLGSRILLAITAAAALLHDSPAVAQQGGNAFAADADEAASGDPAVFLITDRGRERLLDRARRLAADGRWSDAAAACDELLGDDRDAFVDATAGGRPTASVRSEAAAIVAAFPRPGREAYQLLFRGRAEQRLAEAIAADDRELIVSVARRWFDTPAGREAALITAIAALESGQPLAAATWLERVSASEDATEFEPSLSIMRAIAMHLAGESESAKEILSRASASGGNARLGGREFALSASGERGGPQLADVIRAESSGVGSAGRNWLQSRGVPSRNTVVQATKPLLVPRYRVPLVRHPDEARRLERQRRMAADAGMPLVPAGTALAAGDFLVVHTPLGILAVNFETGKRVWLESAVAAAEPEEGDGAAGDPSGRVFDDATSSNLASDGRLVFAVETPPEAFETAEPLVGGFGFGQRNDMAASWNGGNTLSAYDLATGATRWRIPGAEAGEQPASAMWFLGPPLVAGSDLYILCEDGGEARLECRSVEDGRIQWQQPLASYDEHETIMNAEARGRRLAGLSPALAEGILVCPLGAGCVVAIDTATRSLLWAHSYARSPAGDDGQGRGVIRPLGEPCPVIAGGHVLLAPYDGMGLICLQLRDGTPAWPKPLRGRHRIAGVVAGRVIVVGDTVVESLELATSQRVWKLPLAELGRPSGRGILTPTSLLIPLDTPEVIEIGLADGRIKGRSPARGGGVPGNLVAHRGEIISRGVDFLDVFHQEAALESRIETARANDAESPWAAYWGGQAAIERGDVKHGLDLVAQAVATPSLRLPPTGLTDTIVRALDHDFATAAAWQATQGDDGMSPAIARMLVDGYLAGGNPQRAWAACRQLLQDERPVDETGIRDSAEPWLVIAPDRWVRGRLTRVLAAADEPLRREIDTTCRRVVTDLLAAPESPAKRRHMESLANRLGALEVAEPLRQESTGEATGVASRQRAVRATLAKLAPHSREQVASTDIAEINAAWPLGQVTHSLGAASRHEDQGRTHPLPLTLAGAGLPGTRAAQAMLDGGERRLTVTDRFGRPLGDPLPVEGVGQELLMPWVNRTSAIEAAVVGRALFVRTRKELVAYDMDAPLGRGRGLWRRADYASAGDLSVDARWPGGVGGRVARDGGVPLGMRISEPEESPRGDGRGLVARHDCLVVPGPRSLAVLDPVTGGLLWERQRLPAGLEWIVDEGVICGFSNDGRGSMILSLDDGRLLHRLDVPHRRQRLTTHGRGIVAIRSIDSLPGRFTARRVRLDFVDTVAQTTRTLGEFSGEARGTEAGPGRLAVLEPGGEFSVIDLDTASVVFHIKLPDPPRRYERLVVQPWQDRYLVFAGAPDEGDETGDISALQHLMLSSPAAAVMSGRLWAIARADGQPLWPVPVTIERHCLHTAQPPDLPVLTFCRLIRGPGERDQTWLSLLVLDKRTGHAVFEDDRNAVQAHSFLGCDIIGSSDNHTVTVAESGGGAPQVRLTFTGGPIPPQPPYRGGGRQAFAQRLDSLGGSGPRAGAAGPRDDDGVERDLQFFDAEEFE